MEFVFGGLFGIFVLVVIAARPFKHAFPGVKTVHPPSRIAEWGKTAGQKS